MANKEQNNEKFENEIDYGIPAKIALYVDRSVAGLRMETDKKFDRITESMDRKLDTVNSGVNDLNIHYERIATTLDNFIKSRKEQDTKIDTHKTFELGKLGAWIAGIGAVLALIALIVAYSK